MYPDVGFCFASTGKTARSAHNTNISTAHHDKPFIPAKFRQNPAFGFSNRDVMERIMANSSQQSQDLLASASSASQGLVDMFGAFLDSLTPDSANSTPISPPRPKNLSAIFSGSAINLTNFDLPLKSRIHDFP